MLSIKHIEIKIKERISPNAKVWIYQAARPFTQSEVDKLNDQIAAFVQEWAAHGNELVADYQIFFNRFICLFVDESGVTASGCSIDSSVHFIKSLKKEHDISLLSRTDVAYVGQDDEIKSVDLHTLNDAFSEGQITNETLVFNNLIRTKGEMETNWVIPIVDSWHKRMLD